MQEIFEFTDDLGPEKVLHVYEPRLGLRGIVVVDNVAIGPSIGGIRMAPDVSVEECFRLARAMTLKNAAAGLPHGGGKSVIFGDPKMPLAEKERHIRAFAQAIANLESYIPGPDMGTDEICMAWIRAEIGRSVGLPTDVGGIPLDEIGATGFGLAVAVDIAAPHIGLDLDGASVVVQGFGSVGQHAARFLAERGCRLIAASDSGGAIFSEQGLDVAALMQHKATGRGVREFGHGEAIERDAVIGISCDIWIPAARPDVIHEGNVDQLQTRLVPQGANIPLTLGAEESLAKRGVLSLPDFIANAGGVICASVEYHGGSEKQAFETIEACLSKNVRQVLDRVSSDAVLPRQAAVDLARERVVRAMRYRRAF